LWVVERGNVYTIFTVSYGQGGTGQPGAVDITMHATRFNLQDPNFGRAKRSTEFAARLFRSSDPVTFHFPDAVLPSACLGPRRHPRSFQRTHPAIRSTSRALTETYMTLAHRSFSPTGTVCRCACNRLLTDMLPTDVSSHAPAQDTAAHCIPTTVAHKLRPQAESGQDATSPSLLVCTELTALLATSVSWRYANLSSLACVSQQRPQGG
jgi:hypothetical protein